MRNLIQGLWELISNFQFKANKKENLISLFKDFYNEEKKRIESGLLVNRKNKINKTRCYM